MQTVHAQSAEYIRRGYPLETFDEAVSDLRKNGVSVITHVILGLPNETKEMMLQTVRYAGERSDGVKLQLLHVLRGTDLLSDYENGEFETLSLEQYLDILCDAVEVLPENTVIHRLTGDGDKKLLVAPLWSADKKRVLNEMNREFRRRDVVQGRKYKNFGKPLDFVWRDVRAGRRSMIGNHVYGNHRTRGSNPLLSAKVAPVAYASGVRFLFAFLVNVMKRVLVLLIIISLLFCTVTASAASSVSFRTSDCETARNRVFTVNVCAASGSPLCAALFDITYDSSAFDFRGASVQKPALVETNSEDGRVRLDYLNAGGTDCSEEAVIFTLSFKSKKAGTYTFGYTVSQCVDSDGPRQLKCKPCRSSGTLCGQYGFVGSGGTRDSESPLRNQTPKSRRQ